MLRFNSVRGALLLCFILATACTTLGESPFGDAAIIPDGIADAPPLGPHLSSLRANFLDQSCIAPCHSGGENAAGSMDLSSDAHAQLVGVAAMGTGCSGSGRMRVVPGMPDESLLWLKPHSKVEGIAAPCGDPMPLGATRDPISQEELDAIRGWITAGALDD